MQDYRRGHLSFSTFFMSFAASHSGCQASTKIGATPAHTGKVHTQVVSCLCFVSTERTRQASCCTSGRRELNFALTWFAFPKRGSRSSNCRTVPLVSARWKLGFLRQLSSFPLGYPKTVSVSSVQELLASQLLPSTLIGSNNVQVARLVMGCHECIRACLGMFLCISSQYSSKPSSGR